MLTQKRSIALAIAACAGLGLITVPAQAGTLTTPAGLTAGETYRYIYVTTGTIAAGPTTPLTGTGSYDALAQGDAASNGYVTSQAATWEALVSDNAAGVTAAGRIPGNDAFFLPDGTEIADSTSDLFGGEPLLNPIGSTATDVWTGSNSTGAAKGIFFPPIIDVSYDVSSASPEFGTANATNSSWIANDTGDPSIALPVYAFSNELTAPSSTPLPKPFWGLLGLGATAMLARGLGLFSKRKDRISTT